MKQIALILLLVISCCAPRLAFAQTGPLPETGKPTTGYASVSAALVALRANPKIQFTVKHGWTIARDDENKTIWSFAPKDDPSYPSVVKRTITEHDGKLLVNMSVDCEASKSACDQLVLRFRHLNELIPKRMQQMSNQSSKRAY